MTDSPAYRTDLEARALDCLAALVASGLDSDPVARGLTIGAAYAELLDADWCRVWWVNRDRSKAHILSHYPQTTLDEEWQHTKSLVDEKSTIVSRVITTGVAEIEADAASNPNIETRFVTALGARSGCHFPLRVGGETVGDLALISTREKAHFDPEDSHVFELLAAFASVALAPLDPATVVGS